MTRDALVLAAVIALVIDTTIVAAGIASVLDAEETDR